MANIKLTVTDTITDYKSIVFRAPANSESITSVLLNNTNYDLVDSNNRSILGKSGFFISGSKVSVIADVTNQRLYITNSSNLIVGDDVCASLSIDTGSTATQALVAKSQNLGGVKVVELALGDMSINKSTMPTTAQWFSVCYGGGLFVAVAADSNTMAYSTDGITWTQGTMPANANWASVCYGGDKFVAVATGSSTMAYSYYGINWTQGTMPTSTNWNSVCYGNGKFVAVVYNSSNTMAYSTNGINWTQGTMPTTANWASVCYGNDKFVAVAYNSSTMAYSTDGINWTQGTMPTSTYWFSVCYGNNMFVAVVAGLSKMAYSTDGINWTQGTMPAYARWRSVCYGGGKFVAVVYNSSTTAYIIPSYSLILDSVELGSQSIFRSPASISQILINSDTYDIVDVEGASVSLTSRALNLVVLDPVNHKAYLKNRCKKS